MMNSSEFGKFIPVNGLSFQKKMSKHEEYALRLGFSLQEKFPDVAFLVQPVLGKVRSTEEESIKLSLTVVKILSKDKISDLAQHCQSEHASDCQILVDTYTIEGENWRPLIEMQQYENKYTVRCFASHRALYKAATEYVSSAELQKFWSLGIVRSYVEQNTDLKKSLIDKGVSPEEICEHFAESPKHESSDFDGSAIINGCADCIRLKNYS